MPFGKKGLAEEIIPQIRSLKVPVLKGARSPAYLEPEVRKLAKAMDGNPVRHGTCCRSGTGLSPSRL